MNEPVVNQLEPEKKRTRRFRKRNFKCLPPPAIAVKPLWQQASEEDKTRAHQQCTTILQLWLGKLTKEQAMAELELPALRLWQLSQQALSGMIAGLLKQPRTRVKGTAMPVDPENDPKILKKRIAQLEKELAIVNSVNEVLKLLPSNREPSATRPGAKEVAAKRPKPKSRTSVSSSRSRAKESREPAPELSPNTEG
jgi:hypothetical protein